MGTTARKRAGLGMVAGAALMAMAGTAFACTEVKGQITINGISGLSTGSATYVGDGGEFADTPGAGYCGGKPPRLTMTSAVPGALAFTLTVAPGTCDGVTRKLAQGLWEVRWVAAEDGEIDNTTPYPKCHGLAPSAGSAWVPVGELPVDATGSGSGTYSLSGAQAGPGNICVDPVDIYDNTAPPVIPIKWTI